jgi:hypothetical protein
MGLSNNERKLLKEQNDQRRILEKCLCALNQIPKTRINRLNMDTHTLATRIPGTPDRAGQDHRPRFRRRQDGHRAQIGDRDLLQKLEEIDKFSEQDKTTIKAILDTYILKNRFQKLANSPETQSAQR